MSEQRNVVAVLFGDPLSAHKRADRANKVLWIMRAPREGKPLKLTGRLARGKVTRVRLTVPADSAPGEIYPSIVNVPQSGCWRFFLAWNSHHATINLAYR